MSRKIWVVGTVLVALCALMMAGPLAASAEVLSNDDCLMCHGEDGSPPQLFQVSGTSCQKCHLPSLQNTHPSHGGGGNCGGPCHSSYGWSLGARVPRYLSTGPYAGAAFAGPESLNTPSQVLHTIHSNPRWMAKVSKANSKCGSCHATAACTACHIGTVSDTHANHGDYPGTTSTVLTPWVGDVSPGVTADQAEDTMMVNASVKCGSAACHDTTGTALSAPLKMDTYVFPGKLPAGFVPASVTTSGTWQALSGPQYALSREYHSNYTNRAMSLQFTGERVTLIADKDPYNGIIAISVDGSVETTVDLYGATTLYQRPVWTSAALGAGSHIVRFRVTGDRNPASRGTWVSVDAIEFEAFAKDSISPTCSSCHQAESDSDGHQGLPYRLNYDHIATQTISASRVETAFAAWGTYTCDECHNPSLRDEHYKRDSSSGFQDKGIYSDSCTICHPTTLSKDPTRSLEASYVANRRSSVASEWTGLFLHNDSCNFAHCHDNQDPQGAERVTHGNFVSRHATGTAGESAACSACHPGDLRYLHSNQDPRYVDNGKIETDGCLACHSASTFDTDPTCSNCHVGGYASVSTTGHPIKDAASHNASETGKPFTSAYQGGRADQTDGGFECAACHTTQLVANHSTPGTMTAVGCASGGAGSKGCHMDTAYNSINVAGGGWVSRKCSDCHADSSSVRQSHNSTATPHYVSSNGCAGSADGCHESNDLWELHAVAYNGGAPKYQDCANAGCHDSANINKRPALISIADSCGSTSPNTGCHTGLAVDHATNFQHTFSAVSQYNGGTETGCTNQSGCHNAGGTSTADYGDEFHPASGCFAPTGKCHVSTSKSSFSGILPTDCQECHNGTYVGAGPSRVNLTLAPDSGGHYSDTTHTATGMTDTIDAGGSATATCANCHPGTLMSQHSTITIGGSPYGGATSCGECHADTRANGNAQVVANWTNNTCADCHTAGSTSPFSHVTTSGAVAEVGSTCGATGAGCHNSTDLHLLHKNAAGGCSLTGCHVYGVQSQRPAAKGCGGATSCHTGYTNTVHGPVVTANEALHTDTAMTGTITQGAASATCSACHTGTLGSAHANSMTGWTNICTDCHNSTLGTSVSPTQVKTNWTADDCLDCHTSGTGNPNKIANWHSKYGTASHQGTTTQGCGNSGAGCHNTLDLAVLHGVTKTNGCNLAGCHDSQNKAMGSAAKSCGSGGTCHETYTASVHGDVNGTETTHTALGLTTVLDATYNAGGANTCNTCHSDGLETAHGTSITGNLATPAWTSPMCDECHGGDTSPVTGAVSVIKTTKWPGKDCEECHGGANGPAKHAEYASGHTATDGANTCASATCHGNTYDLRALHNNPVTGNASPAGCDSAGCHDSLNKEMQGAEKVCGSGTTGCHQDKTDDNHGSATAHTFTATSNYDSAAETGCNNSGTGCHGSTATTNYATEGLHGILASSTAPTGCLNSLCHTDATSKAAHPSPEECVQCHTTGATNWNGVTARSLLTSSPANGGHYSDTTHTASGMTDAIDAGGSASATCNNCHSPNVGTAWGTGLMNQHYSITPTATSTYGVTVGCGECHNDTTSNGQSQEAANWANDLCTDCHTADSKSTLDHALSVPSIDDTMTTSCGNTGINCHTTKDIHALHKNAAGGCNLTDCHDYTKQAYVATKRSCGSGSGGCHTAYTLNTAFTTHTNSSETSNHAPTSGNTVQANDTFLGNTCTACHIVTAASGGLMSAEHTGANSVKTLDASNVCLNCHNNTASTTSVADDWSARDTTGACAACHTGSLAIHADANSTAHQATNTGCASTGIGCHNTNDLSSVGATATAANTVLHNSCMHCHDRTGSASWSSALIGTHGNTQYAPTVDTCGQATGCHTSTYYTTTVHRATITNINGLDAQHTDSAMTATIGAGPKASCGDCHSAQLANAHKESSTTAGLNNTSTGWDDTAETQCRDCHNSTISSSVAANQVKGHWSTNDCGDCHVAGASSTKIPNLHSRFNGTNHIGVPSGGLAATCGTSGCHETKELAVLHEGTTNGCATAQCHDSKDKQMTGAAVGCGAGSACHNDAKYSVAHGGNHNADMGIVTDSGTNYVLGMNEGCFGCHYADLTLEHGDDSVSGVAAAGRTMQKDSGNYAASGNDRCGACHSDQGGAGGTGGDGKFDEGSNSWVQAALSSSKTGGRRCDACHKGNGTTGPRVMHGGGTVPNTPAYTGNAPAEFLNYPQGGGHGALASMTTPYSKGGSVVYLSGTNNKVTSSWAYKGTWPASPPSYVDAGETLGTSMVMKCEYCHQWTSGTYPNGPQGASGIITTRNNGVAYSTATFAQRASTICGDCHPTASGKHGSHGSTKCTYCHIAIPHAWKRHGLLRRTQYGTLTVIVSDGGSGAMTNGTYTFTADTAPYIQAGAESGIVAYTPGAFGGTWDGGNCETGGCRGSHAPAGSLGATNVWP